MYKIKQERKKRGRRRERGGGGRRRERGGGGEVEDSEGKINSYKDIF